MKGIFKRLTRDQRGGALILTLVLLVVGGLILAPLLGHMGTGHTAGQVHEKRMDELYAADAGVEEAVWCIREGMTPDVGDEMLLTDLIHQLSDGANYKTVEVMLFTKSEGVAGGTYRITSNATTPEHGSTIIESWLDYMPAFWNNAITTPGEIYLPRNVIVDGDTAGTVTYPSPQARGEVTGEEKEPWDENAWPFGLSVDYWRNFYLDPPLPIHPANCNYTLDVAGTEPLGPWEFTGCDVAIKSTSNTNVIGTLEGTIYVSGSNQKLTIGGSHDFVLDLNNRTIFVEGNRKAPGSSSAANHYALDIQSNVTLKGSGIIIAVGDIQFMPNFVAGSSDDFVLVISLDGKIAAHPNALFYGSMAARDGVQLTGSAGTELKHVLVEHTTPDPGMLNFPTDPEGYHKIFIRTWTVELTNQ